MIFTRWRLHDAVVLLHLYLFACNLHKTRLRLNFCSGMGCFFQLQVKISGHCLDHKALKEIKSHIKLAYCSHPLLYNYDCYLSGVSDWYSELTTLSQDPKQKYYKGQNKAMLLLRLVTSTSASAWVEHIAPFMFGAGRPGLIHNASTAMWNYP